MPSFSLSCGGVGHRVVAILMGKSNGLKFLRFFIILITNEVP